MNTRIGSCTAFLTFVHEPAIDVGVFNHVSGYFADVVWQGISTHHVRQGIETHLTLDELREFIAKTPRDTMVLVDEAYFHFADSPDYESVIPLVNDHPNLLVARTFSKIYGMAGLRCGYCVAQKPSIDRMHARQMWDSVNIMALAAASASLEDPDQVPNGQRLNKEAKSFTVHELEKVGYKTIPSQANFIMFDCKRPVVPLIQAMKERNVHVGRLFPSLPNHMRVTIGKSSEMESFVSVFKQVAA